MSPRSEEFMDQARDRTAAAAELLQADHLETAVSTAYYAMFYAAKAALSEDDEYARSHRGTWHLFHQRFVATDAFDEDLHALAQRAQKAREGADYEAKTPPQEEAKSYVDGAADFLAAIEAMLAG